MKEHIYKPDLLDEKNDLIFDGFIKVSLPSYKERQKIRNDFKQLEKIDIEQFLLDLAEKSILEMNLKIKCLDKQITDFDSLMDYQEGSVIAIKLGEIQSSGISLGNDLKKLLNSK